MITIDFEGWKKIKVASFVAAPHHTGRSGGMLPSRAILDDSVFTRNVDVDSTDLLRHSLRGTNFPKVTVLQTGPSCNLTVIMKSVIISYYSVSTGETPTETVNLSFESIEYTIACV